jgi:DNA-binding beta-propeller fold protein YncE
LLDPTAGETTVVPLGAGAEGSAVVEARSELWVGNAGDGSLSVVDLSVRREVERIEDVCRMPIALAADGELVWVACFLDSELLAVDAARRSVTKRLPLTARPLNLLLHPELALAYISLPRENAVAEIDLASGAETRRIPVGIEPDGLRWATP